MTQTHEYDLEAIANIQEGWRLCQEENDRLRPLLAEYEAKIEAQAESIAELVGALERLEKAVRPFESKMDAAMGKGNSARMPAMDAARAAIAKAEGRS